jgi:Zinc finger, C2H2 type/C2H2-type zinc finger
MDTRFKVPSSIILSDPSQSDKTIWPLKALEHIDDFFEESKCKQNIIFFYHQYQKDLFRCHICGRSFSRKWNMEQHKLSHGTLIIQCNSCEKTFHSKNGLKQHEETHRTYFQCTKCERVFKRLQDSKHHYFTHFSPTNMCDRCGKMFFHIKGLKQHMKFSHR